MPRMNMFVHGKFYKRNAGCMQGVDAGMHVICINAENEHVLCNGGVHI